MVGTYTQQDTPTNSHYTCTTNMYTNTPDTHASYLWVAMFSNIHFSEGTNVTHSRNINSEIAEKVYYIGGFWAKPKVEDEGSDERAEQLINNIHLMMGGGGGGGERKGDG